MPTNLVEVVSKPQIKFKGKASGRSGKRSPAAGGMSHKKGLQRSHCASDGVLKPLLSLGQCFRCGLRVENLALRS